MFTIEDININLIKNKNTEKFFLKINQSSSNEEIKKVYATVDQKVKDGYTVLINLKRVFESDNHREEFYITEVSIPKNISEQDYKTIMETVNAFPKETLDSMTIINHTSRNGLEEDYDYYDYGQNVFRIRENHTEEQRQAFEKINSARRPNKILDYFLRKKLDKLSDYEKKMYQDYEEFNLEKLLFDSEIKYNILSNNNCGVITIFPDKTYKSAVTKAQHKGETDQHKKNYSTKTSNVSNVDNYITIQILKEEALLYIPKSLNEYQTNQLNEFFDEVDDLEKFNNKKVNLYGAIIEKSGELNILKECEGMDEIKTCLKTDVKQK